MSWFPLKTPLKKKDFQNVNTPNSHPDGASMNVNVKVHFLIHTRNETKLIIRKQSFNNPVFKYQLSVSGFRILTPFAIPNMQSPKPVFLRIKNYEWIGVGFRCDKDGTVVCSFNYRIKPSIAASNEVLIVFNAIEY